LTGEYGVDVIHTHDTHVGSAHASHVLSEGHLQVHNM
jgi:hypothetical protein